MSMSGTVREAGAALGLINVMVSVETPPAVIEVGLNDLLSWGSPRGGTGTTVRVALLGPALFPLLVCRAPAATVLM